MNLPRQKTSPIYLAGHTGLIGRAFLERLTALGHGNLLLRSREQLDLGDRSRVDAFFDEYRPKTVIFCAGRGGGIQAHRREPADLMADNLAMQLNVIRAAYRARAERFLYFGSSCMYPGDCDQPMREERLLHGKPEASSLPYALAKLSGMHLCLAYNRQASAPRFYCVVTGGIYGPHDRFEPERSHVLPALIRRFDEAKREGAARVTLWGSGNARREFLYVDDLIEACGEILDRDGLAGEPINVGSGRDQSIRELATCVAETVGYRGEIAFDPAQPDGVARKLLEVSRVTALGWRPKTPLQAGIARTYEWFLSKLAP